MKYVNLSGEFLNKHKEMIKFKDVTFNDESIYKCITDSQGIIVEYEEY